MNKDIGATTPNRRNAVSRRIRPVVFCLLCWTVFLVGEVFGEEPRTAPPFPNKPATASGLLTVGSPELSVTADVGSKLGGAGIGEMLSAPFQNLLLESGRFQVLLNRPGQFGIKASISDLKIEGGKTGKKFSFNPIDNDFLRKKIGLREEDAALLKPLADIDWGKAESRFSIECVVSMQLLDVAAGGALLMADTGRHSEETTVKDVSAKLGVLDLSKAGPPMEQVAKYQTVIVEAALRDGLIKLMPKIDALLLQQPASTPTPVAVPIPSAPLSTSQPVATPTGERSSPKFCSECGVKLGMDAKFCSGCGTKIDR